jgi:hypothetical protein
MQKDPTVCIDAVPLLVPSAGVKNYLQYWIETLCGAQQGEVRLFPALSGARLTLRHHASSAGAFDTGRALALYYLVHAADLEILKPRCDLFHATKLMSPPRRSRLSATIHDLTCWLMPECHTAANVRAEREFAERIWKRAHGLIAVSESTRADAVRLLGIDEKRIKVIYSGVSPQYFEAGVAEATAAATALGITPVHPIYRKYRASQEPGRGAGCLRRLDGLRAGGV